MTARETAAQIVARHTVFKAVAEPLIADIEAALHARDEHASMIVKQQVENARKVRDALIDSPDANESAAAKAFDCARVLLDRVALLLVGETEP